MSDVPARLFGLRERGRLEEGFYADIALFDPETVDSGPAKRVFDLPGDSLRLTSVSTGVKKVLVNGVVTIEDGQSTGALPGTVLRSGRNTETVATH
jgi:N-acyl-D-aspartate/D-glutamate deacylase